MRVAVVAVMTSVSCAHPGPPPAPAVVCAPADVSVERGKRMDGDTLATAITGAHAKGRRFEWTVTQPSVRVDCNLALITYVNAGAVGDASRMQPRSWLESAALSYDAGAWRIRFFHSTPVPQE